MTSEEYAHRLGLLKIASAGKVGGLKGAVGGLLIRFDMGLELGLAEIDRLRIALDEAEAAQKAVVDYLCLEYETLKEVANA